MDLTSPLFDRIRASRKKTEEPRARVPPCDHPGCTLPGEHRAPKGRLMEGQYWRFCLEHVREYNRSYNYFSGMNEQDVTRHLQQDQVGHRPTWRMGVDGVAGVRARVSVDGRVDDPFNLFRAAAGPRHGAAGRPRHGIAVRKALEAMDLREDADRETIRARYKQLVRRFHPDANGGDRSFEGRFQEIIQAYGVLRQHGMC
ncbi:J domain-containing protein [Camelimonas abortus]|uniref:J domain-containing protein n=1 Tax=Camelimonas abortus TaxID=1017184 RepID=A0ABV7LB87_9HYPH